jgi:chaperonin subunit
MAKGVQPEATRGRIVVKPGEGEETTVSGIVIPDTAKEKPRRVRSWRSDLGGSKTAPGSRWDVAVATRSSTPSTAGPELREHFEEDNAALERWLNRTSPHGSDRGRSRNRRSLYDLCETEMMKDREIDASNARSVATISPAPRWRGWSRGRDGGARRRPRPSSRGAQDPCSPLRTRSPSRTVCPATPRANGK